jgi:N6-adenosine-specific RNA methylase IME4
VKGLEFHPVAAIFPLMEGQEFEDLKEDIQKNGLIEPVWTYEGKILDGRNRYRACREVGVEPKIREWDGGSAVSLVVSLNLKRRHLTMGQRAQSAAEALPHYEAEAKGRQRLSEGRGKKGSEKIPDLIPEKAADHAARDFKVNPHYIADAKALRERAPDLAAKVKSGEMKIPHAKKELRRRETPDAPPSPAGKFRVIYADPSWEYGNRYGDHLSTYSTPSDHYPTMTLQAICDLAVRDMADENAVLFLWATSPLLEDALRVISSWGFKYKTSFVWDKVKHNFGHYNSVRHEFLLIATKGSCTPDTKELHDSVISIERTEHSAKPEYFRELIDKMYLHGKKVELFARKNTKGWESWGNQNA